MLWLERFLTSTVPTNIDTVVHYHNFPTHPHYHGPGMTYFLGRYVLICLAELSEYVIQGALVVGVGVEILVLR